MQHRHFFGYGSLVNRGTHDYAGAFVGRLTGWRRAWRRSPRRVLCYLTILPAPGAELLGLITPVPQSAQRKLNQREQAYEQARVTEAVTHDAPHAPEIETHIIAEGQHLDPTEGNPILLSYLDVVLQGYLHEFGEAGLSHFLATTDGWQAPILDDRASPVYPRAQILSARETALIDARLAELSPRTIPLTPSSWDKYLGGSGGNAPRPVARRNATGETLNPNTGYER